MLHCWPMNIRYRLTDKEWLESCTARSRVIRWSFASVLGGFFVLLGGLEIISKRSTLASAFTSFAMGAFFIALPYATKLTFRRSPVYGKEVEVQIGTSGVTFKIAAVFSEFGWDAFKEFKETKDLFLLYQTPAFPHPLPKRAFSAEDQNQFRALAKEKIPSRAIPLGLWISVRNFILMAVVAVAFILLLQVLRK